MLQPIHLPAQKIESLLEEFGKENKIEVDITSDQTALYARPTIWDEGLCIRFEMSGIAKKGELLYRVLDVTSGKNKQYSSALTVDGGRDSKSGVYTTVAQLETFLIHKLS